MPIVCHLKIDGVEGESTHSGHAKEIDLLGWSWGVTGAPPAAGGGSGTGKATPGEVHLSKPYDKASPVLAKHCASGKHFVQAMLTCARPGPGAQDFLKITLKEVMVGNVAPSAATGELMETVSLRYADIEFSYKPQAANGALGPEVKFGWNIKTSEIR